MNHRFGLNRTSLSLLKNSADVPTAITPSASTDDTVTLPRGPFAGFELISEIARGGMGVVYQARQISADRMVALKVVRGNNPDPEEVARFIAEARAAARLNHPHIVPVYEVSELNGQPYFSMRLIEGASLSHHLNGSPAEVRTAAELIRIVAEAIQYAHDNNVIHRDIKPGNILLDAAGNPYVTDFGLARITDKSSDLTKDGQVVGTPAFMPPEQALGQRDMVGVRSDVYSLGAVLYACLTGRPPFQAASSMATVMQLLSRDVVPPSRLNGEVDGDIETICLKCLEKNPEQRYASASALADDLQRYLDRKPILARPPSRLERLRKWIVRNPLVAGLSAVSLLAMLILLTGGVVYQLRLERALHAAEASRNAVRESESKRTATLYEALVKQAGFLNDLRPPGFEQQVREAVAEARTLDTAAHDLNQLRQLAVNATGRARAESAVELTRLGAVPQCVDLSPDGQQIIVGLSTGEVVFCEQRTGRQISRFSAHSAPVSGIRFPEETVCYTYTEYCREVIRWELDGSGWHQIRTLDPEKPVGMTDIRMSHDGRYYIGWTNWTPPAGVGTFIAGEVPNLSVAELPADSFFYVRPVDSDSDQIRVIPLSATTAFDWRRDYFAAFTSRQAIVYSFSTNTVIRHFELEEQMRLLCLTPNAGRLVTAGHSGAYVYSLTEERPAEHVFQQDTIAMQVAGESSLINLCAAAQQVILSLDRPSERLVLPRSDKTAWLSSCGRCRFDGSPDSDTIRLTPFKSGECRLFADDKRSVDDVTVSADSSVICCSRNYQSVQLRDSVSGKVVAEVPGSRGVLHPSGRWLAVQKDGFVKLLSVPEMTQVCEASAADRLFNRLRFSSDGTHLAGIGWDGPNFSVYRCENVSGGAQTPQLIPVSDLASEGNSACWSPNENRLAWITHEADRQSFRVRLQSFDDSSHIQIPGCRDPGKKFGSIVWLPQDRIVFLDSRGHLILWDTLSDSQLAESRDVFIRPLCSSPDGQFLLSQHQLISADTLETVFEFPALAPNPWGIDWSRDDSLIAFSYNGGEISVWDLKAVHGQLASLNLDWPACRATTTDPSPQLMSLRDRVQKSRTADLFEVTTESLAESQQKIAMLQNHPAKSEWEALLPALSLTSADQMSTVVETLFQVSENYPLHSEEYAADVLMKYVLGYTASFGVVLTAAEAEQMMQACLEKFDRIQGPAPVTQAVAVMLYGEYAKFLSGQVDQSTKALEYFQRSQELATQLVEKKIFTKRTFGDRWFWFNYSHARLQEQLGNLSQAIDLLQEAHDSAGETGFTFDESILVRQRRRLIQWCHKEGRTEQKAAMLSAYPELAQLLLPTNLLDSWQNVTSGTARSTASRADGGIQFVVHETSSESWHAQYSQNTLLLEEGRTYRLRFDARSPEGRVANVEVARGVPDWSSVGLRNDFQATPEFQTFEYQFQATNIAEINRLSFNLAQATGSLVLRDVVLELVEDTAALE
jgi:serine/threonine protein kinase/WD40 repeat protein